MLVIEPGAEERTQYLCEENFQIEIHETENGLGVEGRKDGCSAVHALWWTATEQ